METVINKIKEVQSNYVGMAIYSTKNNRIVASYNNELNIPLASAAKLVIGFVVTQMVKENKEVDEAFAAVLKYIYKEYSESMLGVSD